MKHYPLNISHAQRENLKKLALFVWNKYPDSERHEGFHMVDFYNTAENWNADHAEFNGPLYPTVTECETVCCFAGHAIEAGIITDHTLIPGTTEFFSENYIPPVGVEGRLKPKSWHVIVDIYFGLTANLPAWKWLFDAPWRFVDNTPRGAAQRAFYALKYGVPFGFLDQMRGNEPLVYKHMTPEILEA